MDLNLDGFIFTVDLKVPLDRRFKAAVITDSIYSSFQDLASTVW